MATRSLYPIMFFFPPACIVLSFLLIKTTVRGMTHLSWPLRPVSCPPHSTSCTTSPPYPGILDSDTWKMWTTYQALMHITLPTPMYCHCQHKHQRVTLKVTTQAKEEKDGVCVWSYVRLSQTDNSHAFQGKMRLIRWEMGGGFILMYGHSISFKRPSKETRNKYDRIDVTYLEEIWIYPHQIIKKYMCIHKIRGLSPSLFGENGGRNIKMYLFVDIVRPFLGHNNNPVSVSHMLTNW